MDSIPAGASAKVTLQLTPPGDLALGDYTGQLAINGLSDASLVVPYTFRAISGAKGDLALTVVDEYYYFTADKPRVGGAELRLLDAYSGTEVVSGTTATDGTFTFPDLPEGYYTLEATAVDHETTRQTVFVAAGISSDLIIFISLQTVKYVWTVQPQQIEDKTSIAVDATFQTDVPIPVITIDNGIIDLADLTDPGQTMQVNMTITNHGLIAAQKIRFDFGTHPLYLIRPLVSDLGSLSASASGRKPVLADRHASWRGGRDRRFCDDVRRHRRCWTVLDTGVPGLGVSLRTERCREVDADRCH